MSVAIDLTFVSVSEVEAALCIGFADHEFETTRYVVFQRSRDPDDDDGVYVERDGQQYSAHGRVEVCTLSRDQVSFVFAEPLAEALDVPRTFSIRFECSDDVYQRLCTGLGQLFAGTDCKLAT